MNYTQFGENTLYVQRMFSTMSPSCRPEYQEDEMKGVGTRNFGILGERVKRASAYKYGFLKKIASSPKLKKRQDRMRALMYDTSKGIANTNERTKVLARYDKAKKEGDTWRDHIYDDKSMARAPKHIQDERDKYYDLDANSPENGKQWEKVNNMFLKWHYGVPDYVPEKEGWSKPSPTPPPYNPGKENSSPTPPPYNPGKAESSPTPPKQDSFGKRTGKKLLKLLWNPHGN